MAEQSPKAPGPSPSREEKIKYVLDQFEDAVLRDVAEYENLHRVQR